MDETTSLPKDAQVVKNSDKLASSEQNSSWSIWLASFGLQSRCDTSSHCHEPYIHHGYRPNPSCFAYCIKSAFHPSNETLNVWTHGVPCLMMIQHYITFSKSHLHDIYDPLLYPYWFMVAGVVFTLFGSTCAHLFNCLSPGTREVCFCCDYGIIALQAIGLTCTFTFYLCPYSCLLQNSSMFPLFYIILMVGNILSVVGACITRYPNIPHRDYVRVAPYVFLYIMLNLPCMHKYISPQVEDSYVTLEYDDVSPACMLSKSSAAARYYAVLSFVMLAGAVVQAYKVPERWWPGMFDIVGHSHQIFHLFTATGLYYQSILIEQSLLEAMTMQKSGSLRPEMLNITWLTSLFIPIVIALSSLAAALYYGVDLYNFHSKSKVS